MEKENCENTGNEKVSMLDFVEFLSSDSDSDSNEVQNKTNVDQTSSQTDGLVAQKIAAQSKTSLKKKSELLALIHQLHTHIVAMEKEKKSQLYCKNVNYICPYKDLQSMENKFNAERKEERNQIHETLEKIKTNIETFHREKKVLRKHAAYLEKLKVSMEEIEFNIMQFKEKQKLVYEDLLSDEKALEAEVNIYNEKFQLWAQLPVKKKHKQNDFEINNKEAILPAEVEEFEKFIKLAGGHQGGWDDIDHQTFLKLRKQCKNRNQLLSNATLDIPTQSYEDIVQHIEWHDEYCCLRERKREAILRWKRLKENERKGVLFNGEQDSEENDKRKRKKEELMMKEREERFKKLQEWKEQKELEEQRHTEEIDEDRKKQERIKQITEERKRFELKLQVEEYKMRKREEENILKLAKDKKMRKEKMLVSEEERERIKERNEKIMLSKRQQQLSKEYEEEEKERRLEKLKRTVAVTVERDPSRLHKTTQGWKNRIECHDEAAKTHVSGSRMMPHRAVPSWRQGMM